MNSRLDEIQAAILRTKLGHLEAWNETRSRFAALFDELLSTSQSVKPVTRAQRNRHANHLYVVKTVRRDELSTFLKAKHIYTAIHYPNPLHREQLFMANGSAELELPMAETAVQEILSLPLNSHSFEWEIEATAEAILKFDRQ